LFCGEGKTRKRGKGTVNFRKCKSPPLGGCGRGGEAVRKRKSVEYGEEKGLCVCRGRKTVKKEGSEKRYSSEMVVCTE